MVAIRSLLDLLSSAAAVLSLGPVVPFLDRPVLLLAAVAVAGGLWCDRRQRYPLPPRPAGLLAAAGVAWYALQLSRTEVAVPVVHALVVLLAVRLLTAKQARDYLQIFLLALFILAGSSLLSLEAGFVLYLALLIGVVTVSLVLLTVFVTDPRLALPRHDLWPLLRVALLLPAASLVLMLGFFVILPRTAHPLWTFLHPAGRAVTGLSDSVSPGAFAQLAAVKSPAFRAEGAELPPEELYWRVMVLNQPDGNRWVRREPPAEGALRVVGGRPLTLTIYPEPRSDRHLVTLDPPLKVGGVRSQPSPDLVFRSASTGEQRFRYTVQAAPGAELHAREAQPGTFYLAVPERVSARVAESAARIAASGESRDVRLAALAAFFREHQLTYAQDQLPGGPDPVDAFLFEQRRGYCEFFATAYVTMARLAGVPARLVGGYYLVTDDTAHLWAEVLTDAGVWQRVDPSQWASNAGTAIGARRTAGLAPLQQLTDTLNYYWVQSVVVFDLERQLALLREARRSWREFTPATLRSDRLVYPAGILLAGAAATGAWRLYRRRLSREARLLAALRARVRCRLGGDMVVESFGLGELAERLDSAACREFARIYQGAAFRDRPLTAAEYARLLALLKEI